MTAHPFIQSIAKDAADAGKPGYEAAPNGELLRVCAGDTSLSIRLREAIQSLSDEAARGIVYRCIVLEEPVAVVADDLRKSRKAVERILWDSVKALRILMDGE